MQHLIVVDDDRDIRELLSAYLEKHGFQVSTFDSAEAMLGSPWHEMDLLILDVGLPGADGFDLCRSVRAESDIPVIMLTAASDEVDRIVGLELGADDYMSKPFNPRELLARIKALLRRVNKPRAEASADKVPLVIDRKRRQATLHGQALSLTGAEFDLLCVFFENSGAVVSRDVLSRETSAHSGATFGRAIDTSVSRLRSKLAVHCDSDPIVSVRGKGYKLVL